MNISRGQAVKGVVGWGSGGHNHLSLEGGNSSLSSKLKKSKQLNSCRYIIKAIRNEANGSVQWFQKISGLGEGVE